VYQLVLQDIWPILLDLNVELFVWLDIQMLPLQHQIKLQLLEELLLEIVNIVPQIMYMILY
jgi:hypothetical protein